MKLIKFGVPILSLLLMATVSWAVTYQKVGNTKSNQSNVAVTQQNSNNAGTNQNAQVDNDNGNNPNSPNAKAKHHILKHNPKVNGSVPNNNQPQNKNAGPNQNGSSSHQQSYHPPIVSVPNPNNDYHGSTQSGSNSHEGDHHPPNANLPNQNNDYHGSAQNGSNAHEGDHHPPNVNVPDEHHHDHVVNPHPTFPLARMSQRPLIRRDLNINNFPATTYVLPPRVFDDHRHIMFMFAGPTGYWIDDANVTFIFINNGQVVLMQPAMLMVTPNDFTSWPTYYYGSDFDLPYTGTYFLVIRVDYGGVTQYTTTYVDIN